MHSHAGFLNPGAAPRAQGKKVVFVTNNSTKSRAGYLGKFTSLGLKVAAEEIYSSSYAAAAYLESINFPKTKKARPRTARGVPDARAAGRRVTATQAGLAAVAEPVPGEQAPNRWRLATPCGGRSAWGALPRIAGAAHASCRAGAAHAGGASASERSGPRARRCTSWARWASRRSWT